MGEKYAVLANSSYGLYVGNGAGAGDGVVWVSKPPSLQAAMAAASTSATTIFLMAASKQKRKEFTMCYSAPLYS